MRLVQIHHLNLVILDMTDSQSAGSLKNLSKYLKEPLVLLQDYLFAFNSALAKTEVNLLLITTSCTQTAQL